MEGVGEDVFADLLGSMGFFQPVVAALVGLIPNCAASVLLTQLYVEGALRFSSLVAGLCTGAGVGLAVLWRANPSWKQNLFITGLTWAAGAFVGVAMQVIVHCLPDSDVKGLLQNSSLKKYAQTRNLFRPKRLKKGSGFLLLHCFLCKLLSHSYFATAPFGVLGGRGRTSSCLLLTRLYACAIFTIGNDGLHGRKT